MQGCFLNLSGLKTGTKILPGNPGWLTNGMAPSFFSILRPATLPRISSFKASRFPFQFDSMGILLCVNVYPSGTEKRDLSKDFFSIFFNVVVEVPFMMFMTI